MRRGQVLQDENLASYTSWRVGGVAKLCYKPADLADLAEFVKTLPPEQALLWLGLGSNTLIRDAGVQETVILTQGGLNSLTRIDGSFIRAEAGVACGQLARFAARAGLQGLEFLAGIPGTVGGALAMNAGCHGSETWSHVASVEMLDRQGDIHLRGKDQFKVAYRHVEKPKAEEWFVAANFRLQTGNKEESLAKIKALLAHRENTQPIDLPNCGSVFRNPPGDFSARLIEHCGLKGFQIGQAQVSSKHANFIINLGGARAADIETLIETIASQVLEKTGIALIREVHIRGPQTK